MPATYTMPNFEENKELLFEGAKLLSRDLLQATQNTASGLQAVDDKTRAALGSTIQTMGLLIPSLLIRPGIDPVEKGEELCAAFLDPNATPELKKPWLDLLYVQRDFSDISNLSADQPRFVHWAELATIMTGITSTMAEKYPDHYNARYPTPAAREKAMLLEDTQIKFGCYISALANREGRDISSPGIELPAALHDYATTKQDLQSSLMQYRTVAFGEKFEAAPFVVSPNFKSFLHRSGDKTNIRDKRCNDATTYSIQSTFGRLNAAGAPDITWDDLVFIDGKSVKQIVAGKCGMANSAERKEMSNSIIAEALVSGKSRIHAVEITKDADGQFTTHQQEIKPDFSELGETKAIEHGRFRRLFDWGLTKCSTPASRRSQLEAKPMSWEENERLNDAISDLEGQLELENDKAARSVTVHRQAAKRETTNAKRLNAELKDQGLDSSTRIERERHQAVTTTTTEKAMPDPHKEQKEMGK